MNKIVSKTIKYIFDSDYRFDINSNIGLYKLWPDEKYLKRKYRALIGKTLDLDNPKSFNEKIQWLKLYNQNPQYTVMVDKYLVRDYIANSLGEQYLIPLIGVWDKEEDIDFKSLPNQFVLKCNHNSGYGMYICKNKLDMDVDCVRKNLQKGLEQDYYSINREWPYKNIPRKIIAEALMSTKNGEDLRDYKLFCFNGKVKFFKMDFDRFTAHRANYYDLNGRILPFYEADYPADFERKVDIPDSISMMIELAEKLAKDIPFVRVDFYDVDGKVYFGEITFFPASGIGRIEPEQADLEIGELIDLSNINCR